MIKRGLKEKGKLNRLGQVWIETVIYTLIAFILIGAVLAFVKPKIEEMQDRAIIEQTLGMLDDINNVILSIVQGGAGNKRIMEINIKKGSLKINGSEDNIAFKMKSKSTYSEPGKDVNIGNIIVHTEQKDNLNIVTLTNNYSSVYNITYKNKDETKTISKAATPYKLSLSNEGNNKAITSQTCADATNCLNITGYQKSCETYGSTNNCTYTSEKITINVEIV